MLYEVITFVPGHQRRTQCASGIASRRLNPDIPERALAQDTSVGDAVQRHPPGKTKILVAQFRMYRSRQAQHHFFGHRLDGTRDSYNFV